MYDGFKMQLPSYMKQALLDNELLEFKGRYSHKTGEVSHNILTSPYPIGVRDALLKFKIKNTYIEVSGSFHKYFQNGTNYQDYSFEDFKNTLLDLNAKFGIEPSECTIHNLEFGLNIMLQNITANEVINNCMLYKTKSFNIENFGSNGKLKRAILAQYEVKIYDKGLQYSLGNNIVRIEKKVKRMRKLGYVNLERLTQPEFVNLVSYQLLSLWDDVLLYQPNICMASVGKPLKRLYYDWANPNYIENLIVKDSRKFKYERMKLKSVMNESKKHYTHAIIENCMVNKLIEYECEILKTCTKVTAS